MCDANSKILYTGLHLPKEYSNAIHCPLIAIKPVEIDLVRNYFLHLESYTSYIFTSKTAVEIFLSHAKILCNSLIINDLYNKKVYALGKATAAKAKELGFSRLFVAEKETAEGVVDLIDKEGSFQEKYFWPHARGARSVITAYLNKSEYCYLNFILYETISRIPSEVPNLINFNEIIFTSPSTVDAFLEIFNFFPPHISLRAIGPITQAYLNNKLF